MTTDLVAATTAWAAAGSLILSLLTTTVHNASAKRATDLAQAQCQYLEARADLNSVVELSRALASQVAIIEGVVQRVTESACGDGSLSGHRCIAETGHVGTHYDDSTAWYGEVEFPKVAA